jgi:hypothetical protein
MMWVTRGFYSCVLLPFNMYGVLNQDTKTLHKHEQGAPDLHTVCGVTYNLDVERLREISVEQAVNKNNINRCGRCFDNGGGY